MATRKYNFIENEYYHLYNRGVDKRKIFLDINDYNHFLKLMYFCNTNKNIELRNINAGFERGEQLVYIGAYCLMSNHFHILIKERLEEGVSKYMQKLLTAYTMYFNKKYERTGTLYEGKFKSVYIENDQQLKYLYSYIHLNPAKIMDKNWKLKKIKNKKELLDYVYLYKYSSIQEFKNNRFSILNPKEFPQYFKSINELREELFEWLSFNG